MLGAGVPSSTGGTAIGDTGQFGHLALECRQIVHREITHVTMAGGTRQHGHQLNCGREEPCQPFGRDIDGQTRAQV